VRHWGLPISDAVQDEIVVLIETLQRTEERLEELTGGEVDTVTGATGRPFLLRKAQDEMRRTVAAEQAAVLDALRASELEFRTLAEAMPQIVWITDADGANTYFSQQWMAYTGLTLDESLGTGWAVPFHPEDREAAKDAWDRATATSGTYMIESRLRRADGVYRWWLLRGVPQRDSSERVTKWFGTCTDVHDLKLAQLEVLHANEALLRQQGELRVLFDIMPAMVWFKDTDDRILRVNQRVADVAGRTIEEIEGKASSEIYPQAAAAYRADDLEVMASGAPKLGYIETVPGPGGEAIWVRTDKVPVRDKDGAVTGVVVMAQDVTEVKKLEEQLRHSQKMEAMGTLAGGIAHDFNNILCAIIGYTEMARSSAAAACPEAAAYLGAVLSGAHRAAALVRHILAFSRQEERRLVPEQLGLVVADALELMRATIPSTITFDVSIADELPLVQADATQVHQVVMNLCTNAWQAMQGGAGRLSVRLEPVVVDESLARANVELRTGAHVVLTVSDTGHGMSPATRDRIFEPFFTTKAPGLGTGLGLAVVHGIIKGHGGAITVYSEPGEGTTFRAYFPVSRAGATPDAVPMPAARTGHGESILFVDDDEALARLGKAMLEELGYRVTVSCEPTAALEAARADPSRFALVISDVTMPVMTGFDLAAGLRAIRADLPVILTTGFADSVMSQGVAAAGIRAMLLKPYTLATLGTAVDGVLGPSRKA
jgi:PAS domain S-box-containing protein